MNISEIKSAPIGLPVVVAEVLVRSKLGGGKNTWTTNSDRWHILKAKPCKGFLTGYASLKNGVAEWYDDHVEWHPEQGPAQFAARVKFSARGREYYARPEDVIPTPEASREITVPHGERAALEKIVAYCEIYLKVEGWNAHIEGIRSDAREGLKGKEREND